MLGWVHTLPVSGMQTAGDREACVPAFNWIHIIYYHIGLQTVILKLFRFKQYLVNLFLNIIGIRLIENQIYYKLKKIKSIFK